MLVKRWICGSRSAASRRPTRCSSAIGSTRTMRPSSGASGRRSECTGVLSSVRRLGCGRVSRVVAQRASLQGRTADRIESLLSARLFLEPQLADGRLYFISSLSGHLSLFAMDAEGGVPEPLLPPQIALQNPELIGGHSFVVLPELDQIVVMIDDDGDEIYRPCVISLEGGFPEPLAADRFEGYRSHLVEVDPDAAVAYFAAESRKESLIHGLRCNLRT